MGKKDEALKMALEALELSKIYIQKSVQRAVARNAAADTIRELSDDLSHHEKTIAALREALEESVRTGWIYEDH